MPGFINNSPFQQIKQLEAGNNPFKGTQRQSSKKFNSIRKKSQIYDKMTSKNMHKSITIKYPCTRERNKIL